MDAPLRRDPAAPAAPALAEARWQVRLLGAVEARRPDGQRVRSFPTRPVAALLALLALSPQRTHAREAVIEQLWPGVAPDVGRNRLRQALSTLKTLLERGADAGGPLLLADRVHLRVADGALGCDALDFEQAVQRGDRAAALALYQGELMPGHYLDWVNQARERLQALRDALSSLPQGWQAARPRVETRGLPVYLTRAYGIDAQAERLLAALAADRMVTVHGPGGCGKTRLAVHAAQVLARRAEPPFRRVVFVPLAGCETADRLLEAVEQAIGADGSGEPSRVVQAALLGEPVLLLLDNAEQLLAEAAAAVDGLLAALPQLHVVLTSRRLLGLAGERAFVLAGLPAQRPTAADADDGDDGDAAAVALFIDRAQAAGGAIGAPGLDRAAIVEIVQGLDGLPLAIELAASRLRSLSLHEMLQSLRQGRMLELLERSLPTPAADGRHDSMRRVLQWSWSLLAAPQRSLMQTLATFGAPARPETVAHVAGRPVGPVRNALDALLGLSMVRGQVDRHRRQRWALPQPVREFVAEQTPGDEARAARARLCGWLMDWAGTPEARDGLDERPLALASLDAAVADGALQPALQLALAMRTHWEMHPMPLSTQRVLEAGLQNAGAPLPADLRSEAHELLALARIVAGHAVESRQHAEQAVALAVGPRARCMALARWVFAAYSDGRFDLDYDRAFAEGERCAEACGDPVALLQLLLTKMLIVCNLKLDFAEAERLAEQCAALGEATGRRTSVHLARANLAVLWAGRGRIDDGLELLDAVSRALLADGDRLRAAMCLRQQGRVLVGAKRFAEAKQRLRDSLHLAWSLRAMQSVANTLVHLPSALLFDDADAAARLLGFAMAHWERLFLRLNPIEQREIKRARRRLACRLGAGRVQALMLAGRSLPLHAALELALPGLVVDGGEA